MGAGSPAERRLRVLAAALLAAVATCAQAVGASDRQFGTDVRGLAAAAQRDVVWLGPGILGLPLREAELSADPTATLVLYSDGRPDPAAPGARTLLVQSTQPASLRRRDPNPRFGGAVARRLDRFEIVFRRGRAVALLTSSEPLSDAQMAALLRRARLVHPPG